MDLIESGIKKGIEQHRNRTPGIPAGEEKIKKMKLPDPVQTPVILSVAFCFLMCLPACEPKEEQRNVIFILADDLGVMDLSIQGSRYYETPNIDRIGYRGMQFTRGYASSRVCSPSRASIMTGKHTARHGITDWIGAKYGEA